MKQNQPEVNEEQVVLENKTVFGVYERITYVDNANWTLKLPLLATEEDANYRKNDLEEISHAHGLMTDYKVEPLEVEQTYSEARDFMFNEAENETLGLRKW
jgi:hypothetical protein